jgi:hypothetical protein
MRDLMQLEKGEQSILAYFSSGAHAAEAVQDLVTSGLVPEPGAIQLSKISGYGSQSNARYHFPPSRATTLSGLTLHSAESGAKGSPNPLLAATDWVSGLANSDPTDAQAASFVLTLVTSSEQLETAAKIIKSHGGIV